MGLPLTILILSQEDLSEAVFPIPDPSFRTSDGPQTACPCFGVATPR